MKQKSILLAFIVTQCIYAQEVKQDSINQEIEKQIQAVEIVAKKKLIERKSDKLIFNVEQSIATTGGDVIDALKLTPGVKVDNDNISLIGKGNIIILIDDKPVQLSGEALSNYLRSIKSEDIKSIEVMRNPPAKYTAEGNAGVLNIVTKNTKKNTWNASLRGVFQQATYPSGSGSATFNIQKNRWTISSSVVYRNGKNLPDFFSNIFYPETTWRSNSTQKNFNKGASSNIRVDYKISDKLTNGFIYRWGESSNDSQNNNITRVIDNSTNLLEKSINTLSNTFDGNDTHIFNYHLIYKMDSLGRKLSLDYDMMHRSGDTDKQNFTNEIGNYILLVDNLRIRNLGSQNIQNHSLNIDMEHPLKNGFNLNYGTRMSFSKTHNTFQHFDFQSGIEVLNKNKSNQFNYQENTQSVYFSAQKSWNEIWDIKAGLRLENTQTNGYSATADQRNKKKYTELFPTFYISYTPNEKHTFSLNYGRRLRRPNYYFLDPFRAIRSPYSYSEGNPFLRPSFSHNIELEYNYKEISMTQLYYNKTNGGVVWVSQINPQTKVAFDIPQNALTQDTFGASQTFMLKPFKFWNTRLVADVYYDDVKSKASSSLPYLKAWNSVFTFSNDITLNKKKTISLSLQYRFIPKGTDEVDYSEEMNKVDLSLKMLFLNKKMVVNLYANDIFRSDKPIFTGYYSGIKNVFGNYFDQRFFRLSLSYSFGKKFSHQEHQSKNQEEINRANN